MWRCSLTSPFNVGHLQFHVWLYANENSLDSNHLLPGSTTSRQCLDIILCLQGETRSHRYHQRRINTSHILQEHRYSCWGRTSASCHSLWHAFHTRHLGLRCSLLYSRLATLPPLPLALHSQYRRWIIRLLRAQNQQSALQDRLH
jgi:hypothetical protein